MWCRNNNHEWSTHLSQSSFISQFNGCRGCSSTSCCCWSWLHMLLKFVTIITCRKKSIQMRCFMTRYVTRVTSLANHSHWLSLIRIAVNWLYLTPIWCQYWYHNAGVAWSVLIVSVNADFELGCVFYSGVQMSVITGLRKTEQKCNHIPINSIEELYTIHLTDVHNCLHISIFTVKYSRNKFENDAEKNRYKMLYV